MKSIHFQTLCGASGDMILATLIDLGASIDHLRDQLSRLGIEGLSIETEKMVRSGISCRHMKLGWADQTAYRHLPRIKALISEGGYPARVIERCNRVLDRLAEAEALVHNIDVDKVHFHEIGAVDTIVDVLGTCLCLENLGAGAVTFSTLTVGHGTITCDHGEMPVPAPATAEMLRGYRMATLDIPTEILTPTGCAILTALGTQAPDGPSGSLRGIGYGCGTKKFDRVPNLLRAYLVDAEGDGGMLSDTVVVLESDMDHVGGEIMAFAAEELFAAGCLDVSWTAVYMKKGRPGYRLTVLSPLDRAEHLVKVIMRNTRSLGVRFQTVSRRVASRSFVKTSAFGEELTAKVCRIGDRTVTKLEYEDLAAIARRRGVPLIELMDQYGAGR